MAKLIRKARALQEIVDDLSARVSTLEQAVTDLIEASTRAKPAAKAAPKPHNRG
jgi:hypothetical protein